jgi:hypothetical protein
MSDPPLEHFRCPAQVCHNDEQGLTFGDAKRFYLHWYSTHKPRCPRTDCKFSLKDLSKTTESYFLRHWATHFPELKPEQSACVGCGRHFANANNRDRHAAKCMSGTSDNDHIVADETMHGYDMDATLDAVGAIAPQGDHFDWSAQIGDQDPCNTLVFDAEHSFLNEFALPSFCMAEASSTITVAPPISTSCVAVSGVDPYSDYIMIEQTSSFSLPNDSLSLPIPGSRVIELEQESANNFGGAKLDHMLDTNVLEVTTGANVVASSSRKRLWEGKTTQGKKKHQIVVPDADHCDASSSVFDTHKGADITGEIWPSPGIPESMSQGGQLPLNLATPHPSTSVSFQITDDCDYPMSRGTHSVTLPLRIRKQYTLTKAWTRTVSKQQSRCVRQSRRLIAVKSFVQTATGRQQVSYDHHLWVHKVVQRSRKTIDTTSILVNNVLISKKTRFPRVSGSRALRLIDLHAIIVELSLTWYSLSTTTLPSFSSAQRVSATKSTGF